MTGFSGLIVDEPIGPRWDLAVALIASGEDSVMLGSVELKRDATGPRADGVIRVVVRSATQHPTEGAARAEIELAKANIALAAAADPRFKDLLARYGARWDLVDDYGNGTRLLAQVDDDGNLRWATGSRLT